jgi:hypothetical protein
MAKPSAAGVLSLSPDPPIIVDESLSRARVETHPPDRRRILVVNHMERRRR